MFALRCSVYNLQKIRLKLTELNAVAAGKRSLRGSPRNAPELRRVQTNTVTTEAQPLVPLHHEPETEVILKEVSKFDFATKQQQSLSQIEAKLQDEISKAAKIGLPTFNLAAHIKTSETLQQLIQLGVDLHSLERRKGIPQFVLRLNFDNDIKPFLMFLHDQGVQADDLGAWITKNPLIFKEDKDDLQTRINYLESKKFTTAQIARIVTRNPFWLMFSTKRVDRRLGYFQKEFCLSGNEVRALATQQPRLITYNMEHIRKSTFCVREEMGFTGDDLKCLLLRKPTIWIMDSDKVVECFAFAYHKMQLSHDMLLKFPEVLTSREFRLKQRHEFLKYLGRAQYNPQKDLYISPKTVVEGNDYFFAKHVAKSDIETYELFLKTS